MIQLLIRSKDRACQTDLLLRSIEKFAQNTFYITVTYLASDSQYQRAYDRLTEKFDIQIRPKVDSKKDMVELLEDETSDWFAISTDDTVIFRHLPEYSSWRHKLDDDIDVFSLRLGYNTLVQNIHANPPTIQPPLNNPIDEGDSISWNFQDYDPLHNYGYPFSLDMHVFRREILLEICKQLNWNRPSELEGQLNQYRRFLKPAMRSFKHSVAVNTPNNNLSGQTEHGHKHSYSLQELNDAFLEEKVIDLDLIAEQKVVGCHQEMPYRLIKEK